MKAQFNTGSTPEEVYRDGMEFYSTMLHEMTHSTMTPRGSTGKWAVSSATRSMPREGACGGADCSNDFAFYGV